MRAALRLLAAPVLLALLMTNIAEASGFSCRESVMAETSLGLAALGLRVAKGGPLEILAIGSSSTEGVGASAPDKTYPAKLQSLLSKAWTGAQPRIVNAGIGGEKAPETLARLKKALADKRYDLVIWQVGTNDAVNGGDIEAFRAMVVEGVETVKATNTPLVMLDPQFFPGIREPERYRSYVDAIAQVGRERTVPVFRRYDAMLGWYRSDATAFSAALAGDAFHMSDLGYDCLARDMALSLVELTAKGRPQVATAR